MEGVPQLTSKVAWCQAEEQNYSAGCVQAVGHVITKPLYSKILPDYWV